MRPQRKNGNGNTNAKVQEKGSRGGNSGGHGKAAHRPTDDNGVHSRNQTEKSSGSGASNSDNDLDQRILVMEKAVGAAFYRNILREAGQPGKVDPRCNCETESAANAEVACSRLGRLEAVTKRTDPNPLRALLAKLQAPPLGQIADIKDTAKCCARTRTARRARPTASSLNKTRTALVRLDAEGTLQLRGAG
jgi:hypothetical protein